MIRIPMATIIKKDYPISLKSTMKIKQTNTIDYPVTTNFFYDKKNFSANIGPKHAIVLIILMIKMPSAIDGGKSPSSLICLMIVADRILIPHNPERTLIHVKIKLFHVALLYFLLKNAS